jgi:hypothetical protein
VDNSEKTVDKFDDIVGTIILSVIGLVLIFGILLPVGLTLSSLAWKSAFCSLDIGNHCEIFDDHDTIDSTNTP